MILTIASHVIQAQDFRGPHVVIAKQIKLKSIDFEKGARELVFGDTVHVVARPNALTYEIRVDSLRYKVRKDLVVRASEFDRTLTTPIDVDSAEEVGITPIEPYERVHTFRVGWSSGIAFPIETGSSAETGLAWTAQMDVLLNSLNTHATFAYQSLSHSELDSDNDRFETRTDAFVFGITQGFGSTPKRVSPYVSLLFGVTASPGNNILAIPGLGIDYYVTPHAVLFSELQVTVDLHELTMIYIPLRFGLRCAL